MFQRFRNWLLGSSGLKEATRDAAREATREGFLEGIRLGLEDAMTELTGIAEKPRPIEIVQTNGHHAETNGHHAETETVDPITAAELRGFRKADLINLAEQQGIQADDTWTVQQLKDELTASSATA